MSESGQEVRAAILGVYRQLCADHEMAQRNVEVVQAHQRELMGKINDCFAAARLFEFDLVAEFQGEANGDPRQPILRAPEPIAPALFPVPPIYLTNSGPSIKTLVLQAAERAYPRAVRAGSIREDLERRGHAVHEKTVGMTLYRWSLDGYIRRDGRDWYFVLPENRLARKGGSRSLRSSASVVRLVS